MREKLLFDLLIVLILISKLQSVWATVESTMDETISYLEAKVPEDTGIKAYFSARMLGKQVEGTKEENYELKILNRDLMLIEKHTASSAKTGKGNQSLSTARTRITSLVKLEDLSPRITLIYKTAPSEGHDTMKSIYPPHIKIKIKTKPPYKWKVCKNDIAQVIGTLNQNGDNYPELHYGAESCLLLTTDETAAEEIAKALSQLIVLSGNARQIGE